MSNEILANLRVELTNGKLSKLFAPAKIQIDQAAQGLFDSVRSIATSETSVALTGISTPGLAIIYNLDATNYCQLGFETTKTPLRLKPGGIPFVFNLDPATTTLYLKANTAATKVQITVFEA